MRLNLNQLAIFAKVIECGGFSAAAQVLFLSQSSVSKQVQNLEASLRTVLVDRSGPKIRPTPAGRVLLAQTKEMLALADHAVGAVQAAARWPNERLVVGSTAAVGDYLLPAVMRELRRREPDGLFTVVVNSPECLAGALQQGRIGVGVADGPLPPGRYESEELASDEMLLICAPDHPLAGQEVTPADLAAESFLLLEPGSQTRRQLLELLHTWDLVGARTLDLWGTESVREAVRIGLGISLVPRRSVRFELLHGVLAELHVHPGPTPRTVTANWTVARPLSTYEELLLSILREVANAPTTPPTSSTSEPVGRPRPGGAPQPPGIPLQARRAAGAEPPPALDEAESSTHSR
ncbi:LysR family transcriptional regulator [Kitasatospora sp. NPDC090091]|uniref:LysR family transcriptional regulator n=1 Tax=Kitasatospora sp. NPDC090091 TaxID=3364081 RepID=UPI00382AA449